jgi:DNA-binding CsgD family transcriptional regulator
MTRQSINVAELSAIVARMGEAAVDPARWRDLLESMCRAVGATGASLRQKGIRTPDVPYTSSMEELTKAYFREGWHLRDTRLQRLLSLSMKSAVFNDFDVFTYDELKGLFRRDAYFNDFLGKGKLRWSAWIQFRSGRSPWLIGFQRTDAQTPFEPGEISSLQPLSLALTQTANLSAVVGRSVLTGVMDGLDLVRRPAIAIDRAGSVLAVNSAAEAAFDSSVRVSCRKLLVSDENARQQLEKVYAQLKVSLDTDSISANPIIARRFLKRPVLLHLLPLPVAARSPFSGARALLIFSDVSESTSPKVSLLQRVFALTPAEAKLAAHLAGGDSVELAALRLGVSRETVRNQLKAIFLKTDTHRQGELVALLSRL